MNGDLFADDAPQTGREALAAGAVLLRGFAWAQAEELLSALAQVIRQAPFRHQQTPAGHAMSVAMSNCGQTGWITDACGYRYSAFDPQSGKPWPAMPACFLRIAQAAAYEAGYSGFTPDACLINRYAVGAKMSLHQDSDEQALHQPIVSVSLGLPALFLFGGATRTHPCQRVPLWHGDVVVWGGASRLYYHGVQPVKDGPLPLCMKEAVRFNLTFRQV
ncbi:DNA oxidative demethylase AlkB [Dickeya lacustris]|uniref:DNA oxidative demethylase AlkB n=1 Tax=Dickeya lacustris TaxID=2259638 RepID=A0ABY8GCD0_9GAMM|nr:DNA oxidative demethylase AlkB [Dickeya lacustris]WFN57581.1 DNA oxidative demethylase AlkB [Dickeya lacustris]